MPTIHRAIATLLLLLTATTASAGRNTGIDQTIQITGLWRDVRSGIDALLDVVQSGDRASALFKENENRCTEPGRFYFWGTMSGRTFSGNLNACNPQHCVDQGKLPESTSTTVEFTLSENCQFATGSWVQRRIKDCSPDFGPDSESRIDDFNPVRVARCETLEQELALQRYARGVYQYWYDQLEHGDWQVNNDWVHEGGQPLTIAGIPLNSFQSFQDLAVVMVQHQFENAEVGGGTSTGPGGGPGAGPGADSDPRHEATSFLHNCRYDCEPVCPQCQDPSKYHSCMAHETLHCEQEKALCEDMLGTSYKDQPTAWNDHWYDYKKLLQHEIDAYDVGIEVLETMKANGDCR